MDMDGGGVATGRLAALIRRMPRIHFLCLSLALRSLLVEEYKIPSGRVHVTGFGKDAKFFRPMDSSELRCIVSAGAGSRDYKTLAAASRGLGVDVNIAADSTWYREKANVTSS